MRERRSVRLPAVSPKGDRAAIHAMWSGTISFSLVAIPVQLVKAVEPGRVSFRMLHKKDYSPLLRKMVCPEEEKTVPRDEVIRGYEIGPDKYILVTDRELESLSPERSRTIEIMEFIDMDEVDPVYYDRPYYLVPLKGGEKAYALLAEVMDRTNKAGLAKFVMSEREYLVAVKSTEGALTLITLHYRDEILSPDEPEFGEERDESEEKKRMEETIRQMIAGFDPHKYADQRRKQILVLLGKKAKEMPPVEAPGTEKEEGEGPADLVAVLKESMAKLKKDR